MPSRRRKSPPAPHPDPVALAAALAVENLSLGAFAAMTALLRVGGRLPLMKLSLHVGQSYWAVRNHIRRTPYFDYEALPDRKLMVMITPDGEEKFRRTLHRIMRFTEGQTI